MHQETSREQTEDQCLRGYRVYRDLKQCKD